MQGCTNERSNRVLWAALGLTIYRGEGGGCAPSRVPTPRGAAALVLVVIQITGDPSAERTAPPRSTHVQPGDVSHALIQQGERERLNKTPSSSSTMAWW